MSLKMLYKRSKNIREKGRKKWIGEEKTIVLRVGWELFSYTAHLKARATLVVTLESQKQVCCLCQKSRSLDSSERWQAEQTHISDYIVFGQWFMSPSPAVTLPSLTKKKRTKNKIQKSLGVQFFYFKLMLLHLALPLILGNQIFIKYTKMHSGANTLRARFAMRHERQNANVAVLFIHFDLTIWNEHAIYWNSNWLRNYSNDWNCLLITFYGWRKV